MAHTANYPSKNLARAWVFKGCAKTKDVITISHAACDFLQILGWLGNVITCDIDEHVRQCSIGSIEYGDFPKLCLRMPGISIESTVGDYCEKYDISKLGIVDIDLACSIRDATNITIPVLKILVKAGFCGKTYLTFRNGRNDGFGKDAIEERLAYLKKRMPKGTKISNCHTYCSDWIDRKAVKREGSAMCVVEIKHTKNKKKATIEKVVIDSKIEKAENLIYEKYWDGDWVTEFGDRILDSLFKFQDYKLLSFQDLKYLEKVGIDIYRDVVGKGGFWKRAV
jgi:hypothetical protein